MPGFTAINARASEALASKAGAPPEVDETVAHKGKTTKRRQPARKKPAALKNVDQTALDSSTRKPISGKGKKRASHPGDEPESKRRKSGSVKSSMPTTKTAISSTTMTDPDEVNGIKKPSASSTEAGLISLTSMAKLNGFRYTRAQAARSSEIVPHAIQSASVSYAPETSMNSLQRSLPQTTMQAVRNSSKGSSLLYSSSATLAPSTQGVVFTPPSVGLTATLGFSSESGITPEPRGSLPTPVASDPATENNGGTARRNHPQEAQIQFAEFEDSLDEDDDEMIELAKRVEETAQPGQSPPSRVRKLNIRDTHEHDDYGGALLSDEERKLLDAIKIPQDTRRPVVRIKFPPPIMDRSSLFGVTSTSALRTCFRVGEALNAGCQAVRNNRNLVLELYARVTSSWREPKPSRKQHFIINDLYHDKPPFINGTFDLWDQRPLWEQDSRSFLDAGARGIVCRMIARMKRDGTKWRLEILSIWQADWDDVEHVASIYEKTTDDGGL